MTTTTKEQLNKRHQGIVVFKTASQSGDNKVFETFADYSESTQGTGEAHRIIEVGLVDELKGQVVEIEYNHFGVPSLIVEGIKYTISTFFTKYSY